MAMTVAMAMYAAGPQLVTGRDVSVRGGDPALANCDATGLHNEYCTYSGSGEGVGCKATEYSALYQTSNQNANLDKLGDPQGGDYAGCRLFVDCSPERHDDLLDQACTPVLVATTD